MLNSYQKMACFRNLCKVAITDNYLNPTEKDILLTAGQKMGISDLLAWSTLAAANDFKFMMPEDQDTRKEYLECTIRTMVVECDLPDLEYEWCLAIAKQMGFNEVTLQKIVERLSKEACLVSLF